MAAVGSGCSCRRCAAQPDVHCDQTGSRIVRSLSPELKPCATHTTRARRLRSRWRWMATAPPSRHRHLARGTRLFGLVASNAAVSRTMATLAVELTIPMQIIFFG
jgi:hypothetical protein